MKQKHSSNKRTRKVEIRDDVVDSLYSTEPKLALRRGRMGAKRRRRRRRRKRRRRKRRRKRKKRRKKRMRRRY